jgi:hypothetical protein
MAAAQNSRQDAPASLGLGAMPHPTEFFRAPADAGTTRRCPAQSPGLRRDPPGLGQGRDADPVARSANSLLFSWARLHYRFEGAQPLCADPDFIVESWQRTMSLPVTGVFTQAEVASIQAERVRTEPEFQSASQRWTQARVAARAAGLLPDPRAARAGSDASPPAPFQRPAPVGPPERQAFGLSLGVDFLPQLRLCPPGWSAFNSDSKGVDVCFAPAKTLGRVAAGHLLEFEREQLDTASRDTAFESNSAVGVFFAPAAKPGLLAREGMRAWLFDGRLEAVGFVPSDKQAVLDAFRTRFGPPRYEPVPMRNTEGATWVGDRFHFRKGDVSATLNCVEFETDFCSFAEIATDQGREGLKARRRGDATRGVAF